MRGTVRFEERAWRRSRTARLAGLLATAALVLILAACGSSKSSSSGAAPSGSSASGGSSAKGSPITTFTFADVVSTGVSYKNIEEAGRVATQWINAHGGINGHPIKYNFCDTKGTPSAAATCAEQAVAAHATAVIGSFNFAGDAVMPILESAKIPYFGNCCAISPKEFSSAYDFPIGNQPLYAVGLVLRAHQDGCKSLGAVIIQGAELFEPLMTNAAKALGMKPIKYVSLPATATEDSSEAAAVTSGTDCQILIVSETPMTALIPALIQTGAHLRLYGPQGNLDPKSVKGHEAAVNGSVIASYGYTNITTPPWADFRQAMSQYSADPGQDYNSPGGAGTWIAYMAFAQIAKTISGSIDNNSFYAAASKATVNLPGEIPPVNFTKPWGSNGGLKAYDRLFNTYVSFDQLQNGKLVPLTSTFQNVSNLALGKSG
jgi:ABC-type branched-subunit amino acid transport system substrate-binding protein